MWRTNENNTISRCYIIQNNKTIEFSSQKERAQYLKEIMSILNGPVRIMRTPYEVGITEFGNVINGEYIKQDIKIIEPPKIYFMTMKRKRYYGDTLKQLAENVGVNYILLIDWFNGKTAIDIKYRVTKIGYIQGRKTTYLSFHTSGTQYYVLIGEKRFIFNNLNDMSKKLKTNPSYISKLLCGARSTDKCSEIGYYIDGNFTKSEKSSSSEYEKYADKISIKDKEARIKDTARMLDELRLKDLNEFLDIPLFKEDRD